MAPAPPRNPHAPRPPMLPELIALPDPEEDERPEPLFVPDPDLGAWVRRWLFGADSPLLIEDHVHVMDAEIGFVWASCENRRQGRSALGTAQLGRPGNNVQDAWTRAAAEQQRREWFGSLPDLLVTLYAPYCARCEGFQILGLIDHELCHFATKVDRYGEPTYDEETGRPRYVVVGHDVEEFVAVTRRWGNRRREHQDLHDAGRGRPQMDREVANRLVGPPIAGVL